MNTRLISIPLLATFTLLLSLFSQAEGLDDYYVVELTIFTNENPENIQEEKWPTDITLNYPEYLAYFTEEGIFTVYPELVSLAQEAKVTANEADNTNNSDDKTTIVTATPTIVEAQVTEEESNEQQTPVFLPILDKSYLEHTETIQKLNWSKKYNVILNQAWLQKLGAEESAPNIVIQAGEVKSEIHQLAGTINLFKERYLHLKTNLWLVHFTDDSTIKSEQEAEQATENMLIATATMQTETETIENTLSIEKIAIEESWPSPPATEILDYTETRKSLKNKTPGENTTPLLLEATMAEENTEDMPPLPIERIVTMQQKRKMRSREIHYIDHPLFGLMIEVRPYNLPTKE